jgi:peroxiredoxin
MNNPAMKVIVLLILLTVAVAVVLRITKVNHEPATPEVKQWDGNPATLIRSHRGTVLLLLMGMEGCPGTQAITETLKNYSSGKPEGISIVRLDVPPPGEKLETTLKTPLPFTYGTDKERIVAKQLDFFYYPTFYIIGKDGDIRFSGDCDKEKFPEMVNQILNEKPGDKKHIFTPPMPDEGTVAPTFTSKDLRDKDAPLDALKGEKATVLIFARTGCPFSKAAIPGMKKLQESFADKNVAVLIINKDEAADGIKAIYNESAPGMTVIVDDKAEISKAYGVSPVPFCFVLDGAGKITKRMPYTLETAMDAINNALGISSGTSSPAKSGAG